MLTDGSIEQGQSIFAEAMGHVSHQSIACDSREFEELITRFNSYYEMVGSAPVDSDEEVD